MKKPILFQVSALIIFNFNLEAKIKTYKKVSFLSGVC